MRLRPFVASTPRLNLIASTDDFFATVKNDFPAYKKNGFFEKTDEEAIYIYSIRSPLRSHLGILACVDIRDYLEGKIIPHEKTIRRQEQKHVQLLMQRESVIKPPLLTYSENEELQLIMSTYIADHEADYEIQFEEEGQLHRFWALKDTPVANKILTLFRDQIGKVYIADGHHRFATFARLSREKSQMDFSSVMSVFFPFSQLSIYDYNRVVDVFHSISPTLFMAKMSNLFKIKPLFEARKAKKKHQLIMFLKNEWYELKWKKSVFKKHGEKDIILDSMLLNKEVLEGIIGIHDIRADSRIRYVEGTKGIISVYNKTIKDTGRVGFSLFPVCAEELQQIADSGNELPPKSTWFEPRIKNGVIVQDLI